MCDEKGEKIFYSQDSTIQIFVFSTDISIEQKNIILADLGINGECTLITDNICSIRLLSNMDFDELDEYESNLSFNSYGKTAYLLVEELTGDTTILSEEMLAQIEQYYPQYFIITTECDEDTDIIVDIRYDNTPFTFIMNEDRMFQVGDSVYKVYSRL